MEHASREEVGTALRRLVEELVAERRRIVLLERENRELRAQIEAVEQSLRDRRAGLAPRAA